MKPAAFDPLRLVEAAYTQTRDDDAAWLRGILDAAKPLQYGDGAISAYLCDGKQRRWSPVETKDLHAGPKILDEAFTRFRETAVREFPKAFRLSHTFGVATQRTLFPEVPIASFHPLFLADALGIVATDPTLRGCILAFMSATPISLPPRSRATLRMVAAHLAAASRLRPFFARTAGPAEGDAILDSSARLHHAEHDAKTPVARAALIEAVRRSERARGRLRRTAPDEALALWHALVAGRWSLIDRVDSDGRRFLVARRNPPGVLDPRALNEREQQVASHALLGQSNKLIGYQIGLAPSTVAGHLARACRKLGVHSRAELLRIFAERS